MRSILAIVLTLCVVSACANAEPRVYSGKHVMPRVFCAQVVPVWPSEPKVEVPVYEPKSVPMCACRRRVGPRCVSVRPITPVRTALRGVVFVVRGVVLGVRDVRVGIHNRVYHRRTSCCGCG